MPAAAVRAWDRMIDALAYFAALLIGAMALYVSYDVVARYFFNAPTSWSNDLTEYSLVWATFLATRKLEGYRIDMSPATHPIRGDVPDVRQGSANFDQISYAKGQAVLKQLGAYVGDDAFLEGLRAYFREHAWGNTTLEDFIDAVGAASGSDLSEWERAWLDSAGNPHTENMTMEERWTRTAYDTLELITKINDPEYYTAPWVSAKPQVFKLQMPIDRSIIGEEFCVPSEEEFFNQNIRNLAGAGKKVLDPK